jgi:DNA-binding transcriptional ArsR family regulator
MDAFDALSDPTRRRIVELVSERPRSVLELVRHFSLSQPAISKQLGVLRAAGLLSVTSEGTRRWYHLRPEGVVEVTQWLGRHYAMWEKGLDSLDRKVSSRPRARRP